MEEPSRSPLRTLGQVTTLINGEVIIRPVDVDPYANLTEERLQEIIAIVDSRIDSMEDLDQIKSEFVPDQENIQPNKLRIYIEAFKKARSRLTGSRLTESSGGRRKTRKQKRSTKKRKHVRKRKTTRR